MTAAAALLDRLEQLGIVTDIRGTGLRLRPASRLPSDLLADVRAHKTEVLSHLNAAHDTRPIAPAVAGLSAAEWVEQMAEALMANPVYRITKPEVAMVYFRGLALRMLDRTPNPYARITMLEAEQRSDMLSSLKTGEHVRIRCSSEWT